MNDHEYHPFAAQGSHNLAASGGRRSSSDLLAPPTLSSQSARPVLSIRTEGSQPRLACPFYKRSPNQKPKRTSCFHPGFVNIARLKEHLYRRHQIFRCARCNGCFATDAELEKHLGAQVACQDYGYQRDYSDGFDQKQKERLKKRGRKSETNTEEDKWREIFQTLFPDDQAIPTPYCHDAPSPELDNYHRYWQDHFDRVLEHRLGSTPNESTRNLVRDVHEQLFGEFHALRNDDDRSSCTSRASTPMSSASPRTPLYFEDDPPMPADDGEGHGSKRMRIEDPEPEQPLFGELVEGGPHRVNHVSMQYQPPTIILSPAGCESFTQENAIAYLNINDETPSMSARATNTALAPDHARPTHPYPSVLGMPVSPMNDWYGPVTYGGNDFGH